MTTPSDPADARARDEADELAGFRADFAIPAGRIYLDGNSLGLISGRAEAAALRAIGDWKHKAIGGWLEGEPPWFTMAEEVGRAMAGLVGAEPESVVATGSTTGNLHQLLATLYRPEAGRSRIVADALAFPSDLYAIRSHLALRGLDPADDLEIVGSEDGRTISEDAIVAAIERPGAALAVVPSVVYRSGQLLDMGRIAAAGRGGGVIVGFDCSHSIGAVPHRLDGWGADFAFWCSYKYLNGGPGAVGGLYLNRRHFGAAPGLAGWFGMRKDRQFDMGPDFDGAEGAGRLQVGTPHVLSLAPLVGSLETIAEAGIERIRRKSLALTAYLRALAEDRLARHGFGCVTPAEDGRRGGHLALTHPEAARICKAMIARGVIPDHRPPDIVRVAPVALYTRFVDCFEAVARIEAIMDGREYEAFPAGRGLVA